MRSLISETRCNRCDTTERSYGDEPPNGWVEIKLIELLGALHWHYCPKCWTTIKRAVETIERTKAVETPP